MGIHSPQLVCCCCFGIIYRRATGSKLETNVIAATIATKMTPPAVTLKSRFFRDGVTAASAAIGLASMAAVEVLMIAEATSVLENCCFCSELQVRIHLSQLKGHQNKHKLLLLQLPAVNCTWRLFASAHGRKHVQISEPLNRVRLTVSDCRCGSRAYACERHMINI